MELPINPLFNVQERQKMGFLINPYRFGSGVPLLLDNYTGAAAAFSLRKLRTAYTGYCIKIYNVATGAYLDVGFVNGVVDTASILSFLGIQTGFVVTWYDQSGNGNDATIEYGARTPIIAESESIIEYNGKPAIYFYNNYLALENTIPAADDYSIFTVYKRYDTGSFSVFFANLMNVSPFSSFEYNNNIVYVANNVHYSYAANAVAIQSLYSEFSISDVLTLYKNGNSITLTEVDYAYSYDFDVIGTKQSNFSRSYFQEGIIFPSNKSSDRSGIESNINSFYSIY